MEGGGDKETKVLISDFAYLISAFHYFHLDISELSLSSFTSVGRVHGFETGGKRVRGLS